VPNNWTASTQSKIQDYMAQIGAEVQKLNQDGIIGIKDPNSQAQVTQLINNITAAVALILSLTTA
jgi:hypothetical protein